LIFTCLRYCKKALFTHTRQCVHSEYVLYTVSGFASLMTIYIIVTLQLEFEESKWSELGSHVEISSSVIFLTAGSVAYVGISWT
jgi:hypothetical protein